MPEKKNDTERKSAALRLAASGLYNSKTSLGAFLRRKKAQLGAPKAVTATAHKLARIIYAMLRDKTPYAEQGQEYYEQQYRQRVLRNLRRNAQQYGFELVAIPQAA